MHSRKTSVNRVLLSGTGETEISADPARNNNCHVMFLHDQLIFDNSRTNRHEKRAQFLSQSLSFSKHEQIPGLPVAERLFRCMIRDTKQLIKFVLLKPVPERSHSAGLKIMAQHEISPVVVPLVKRNIIVAGHLLAVGQLQPWERSWTHFCQSPEENASLWLKDFQGSMDRHGFYAAS